MGLRRMIGSVRHGPFTSESGYALAKELLTHSEAGGPPDALFCGNDVIALGALQYAQETGIRVPHELCIAALTAFPTHRSRRSA